MASVEFTPNLKRHCECDSLDVSGSTIGEVLEQCCVRNPVLRSYILDDQGRVRKHVAVFIDGVMLTDRNTLLDPLGQHSKVFVMQALSGG